MTPRQKLALDLRQTLEHTASVADWIASRRNTVGPATASLSQYLASLNADLGLIQQALDRPPALAILAGGGIDLPTLVGQIVAHAAQGPDVEKRSRGAAAALMPGERAGGHLAVLRFSASAALAAGPDEFPVAVNLLGLADIAAILVSCYYTIVPGARARAPDHQRLATVYADAGRSLSSATIPGLTDRDVSDLRENLAIAHPDSPALKVLSAHGYWEDLAAVAGHLPAAERLSVLALLWGEHAGLTRIAGQLSDALSRTGNVTEIFCPREALVHRASASGWPAPHPLSILAANTLLGLADEADEPVRIVGRFGQRSALTRSVLSALAAEVTLPVPPPLLGLAPETDLLVFPPIAAPHDFVLPAATAMSRAPSLPQPSLLRAFARAKAMHLLEQAIRRHELTSLLVAVDPDSPADDVLAAPIAGWIAHAQGPTAAARETNSPQLFIAAVRTLVVEERAHDPTAADEAARGWGTRLASTLVDSIGGGFGWPLEWVPGQPFDNLYLHQQASTLRPAFPAERATSMADPSEMRMGAKLMLRAVASMARHLRHLPHEIATLEHALASTDGGLSLILEASIPLSDASQKHRQLRRRLAVARSSLHARIGPLVTNDADEDAIQWRRRAGTMLQYRVSGLAQRRQLGLLLDALSIRESELECAYWRLRSGVARTPAHTSAATSYGLKAWSSDLPETTVARPDAQELTALASSAIDTWCNAMHWTARSSRLAHELRLSSLLLDRIVGELTEGADRSGLGRRLRAVLDQAFSAGPSRQPERLFASCASAVINDFLARLSLDAVATVPSGGRAASPRTTTAYGTSLARGPDPAISSHRPRPMLVQALSASRPLSKIWPDALAALIDGNIAAVGHGSAPGLPTELASRLAPSPFDILEATS